MGGDPLAMVRRRQAAWCRPCGRLPGGEERVAGDHCCLAGTGPWSNTWALAGQVRWAEHMGVKS